MGAAAVLAAYVAGYARTEAAATELAARSAPRRRAPVARPDATPTATPAATPAPDRVVPESEPSTASAPPPERDAGSIAGAIRAAGDNVPAAQPTASARAAKAPDSAGPAAPATTLSGTPAVRTATSTTRVVTASAIPTAPVMSPPSAPTAPAPPPPAPPASRPALPTAAVANADSTSGKGTWKDGTYTGWGTSRHGDIEATVIIEGGKITAAAISRCLTRYSCSWIAHLQPQVAQRQSPEIDNVSGATDSANAFYYAIVEALKHAAP
jgi:uncharacterized protein with FMN-binding domain